MNTILDITPTGKPLSGFNPLEAAAKKVWAAKGLDAKRSIITAEMIDVFAYPQRADKFRNDVAKATTPNKLDKLAADLLLLESGDRVIK
jgi:hypothetical protein